MKNIPFLFVGILFGIVMTKSEAISWFRINEMFRFESFHMYGIIGTAVVVSAIILALMKRFKMKTIQGELIKTPGMNFKLSRHLIAGSIFGLGWAITGCCPGPIFVLLGQGYGIILLVILGALLGTFTYGMVRERLPH
ncbi:MAG: DUF6691 family protein [Bacteroidota bacterium]